MKETYRAHVLDNGLTVLLQENHSAPAISLWIWYRIGSRNEVPGKTGISHFVEHMQFRETERFPSGSGSREIFRCGGTQNAFTGMDCTAFYETVPPERIGLALDLEADRMVNSRFDPKEVETERGIILSEMQQNLSDPNNRMTSAIQKAAFPGHPYGREVIGAAEDLYSLTRDDLYDHYRTWYAPNNAVLTMAGDFDAEEMLPRIEAAFGSIPARPLPEVIIPPEGTIRSPLHIEGTGCGDLNDLRIFWHAPIGRDPDLFALMMLESILIGSVSLTDSEFVTCRTSRLFRKLVEGGMASCISGDHTFTVDPYILSICALIAPGIGAEDVRGSILEEIENIARHGVLPEELSKARKQAKARFAYAAEYPASQAYWLGYSSMFADPSWYTGYLQRLENVRPEDICRAAGTVLRRDNCGTALFFAKEEQQ